MATLSRRERTDATRQSTEAALMAATVELLGEGTPFAELGIEQIVRKAGFSRPTFYSYFRDKRELILKLGEVLRDAVAAAADPWLTSGQGMVRETLQGVLEAYRANRETLAAITEAATYDQEVQAFWRSFNERFAVIATERIAAGVPALDHAHAAARAYALVWMTERSFTEHVADPTRDEDALLDELAGVWQRATNP
ncbi:HTH-type transcriptional regulator EthR [Paraconexibacter sp. AEG42_29]|uniref:HTH-type transcriptional regulator EthR n=1 Tax=Paraconexibacter sp. AEG42_29 TaxID=2997339 RepID=A0AAU7AU64_9ACTN